MNLNRIWGQGQIFAFSALDGNSYAGDDFAGLLSGDRIGIRFFSKIKRELAIILKDCRNVTYDAITGDYIKFILNNEKSIRIIYHKAHLIVGDMCELTQPMVFVEGKADIKKIDNIEIHNTGDGEFTALLADNEKFAFAYGKIEEEVIGLLKEGMMADIDKSEERKLDFYREHKIKATDEHEQLYSKCLSVMKTQLYSPEGSMKDVWSTPDRLPHKHLWLWDSVFHAIGHRHISGELAEKLILAIFYNQREDGFIPHMANVKGCSKITQPPVIAWGAYKIYSETKNIEFLKKVYECNKLFLNWCRENRRKSDEELYVWHVSEDKNCRCDESGMDNSSRFDDVKYLQAIDFSCFMANDIRYMKKISEILGSKEVQMYSEWYEEIKEDINCKLWDDTDNFYYDYNLDEERLHKVQSVATFLTLFAGICDEEKAGKLIKHLNNPEMFKTELPIPSIAVKDKTFGTDMWRGPVWINYNYMICEGLEEYGYNEMAEEIRNKTIESMNRWYKETGTIYEFYDSENRKVSSMLNRKGVFLEPYNIDIRLQAIRDYGWSCTLLCDMLYEKYAK